jgi:hypothetical protein
MGGEEWTVPPLQFRIYTLVPLPSLPPSPMAAFFAEQEGGMHAKIKQQQSKGPEAWGENQYSLLSGPSFLLHHLTPRVRACCPLLHNNIFPPLSVALTRGKGTTAPYTLYPPC